MAVCRGTDRERMRDGRSPHIAIVTSYNDLVSAHHTFEAYPAILKKAVAAAGGVAQVAAGVPGDVRRGHPGRAGDGPEPGQPRRDRDGHGDRAFPRRVRRRAAARDLRQDRPRAPHGGAAVRAPADDPRAGRPDALGAAQQGEGPRPGAASPRAGSAPRDARGRVLVLPRSRDLHLLRHRQQQPARRGAPGAAPARRLLRQPRRPAAGGADRRRRRARRRHDPPR